MPAEFRGRLFDRAEMAGIEVLRIHAPNFYGTSKYSRGLVQLLTPWFHLLAARSGFPAPMSSSPTFRPPFSASLCESSPCGFARLARRM